MESKTKTSGPGKISDNAIYFIHTAISVNSVNLEEIVIMTKCFIIKW